MPPPDLEFTSVQLTPNGLVLKTKREKDYLVPLFEWSYFLKHTQPRLDDPIELFKLHQRFLFDFVGQLYALWIERNLITLKDIQEEVPTYLSHPALQPLVVEAIRKSGKLKRDVGRPKGTAATRIDRETLDVASTIQAHRKTARREAIADALKVESRPDDNVERLERMDRRDRYEQRAKDQALKDLKRTFIPMVSRIPP